MEIITQALSFVSLLVQNMSLRFYSFIGNLVELDARSCFVLLGGTSILLLLMCANSHFALRRMRKKVIGLEDRVQDMREVVSRIEQIESRRFLADLRVGDVRKRPASNLDKDGPVQRRTGLDDHSAPQAASSS